MSPEFRFTRPEDKSCTDQAVLERLSNTFEAKARANGGNAILLQAIRDQLENVLWVGDVLEPMPSQVLQLHAGRATHDALSCSGRYDYLAAVRC